MGTFLRCAGEPHIPEERQEEFHQKMLRLFRAGGMFSSERVEMFGKRISLLHDPEPDENGTYQFCYNYFENDCWEDAGLFHGEEVFSGKVGWKQ